MKQAFSILFIIMACACGDTNSREIAAPTDDRLFAFNDFPDSLFLGLYFDQPIEDSRQNLEQNSFVLIDSSGSWRYLNSQDSSEVILPVNENLHSFKLMMKSSEIFEVIELMHALFRLNATSAERNGGFSIYTYEQQNLSFKLSVFEQSDIIRLNFEEQMRK